MLICHAEELIYYVIWWGRTIDEKEIIVFNIVFDEILLVILFFIQSDYPGYAKLLKYFYIFFRMVPVSLICITFLYRTHECHEFPRNNPIDITILDSLIKLVLLDIECAEIVPFELNGVLESLQALQHRALV